MKKYGSILSKVLVVLVVLTVTISLAVFPLFNWGLPLKNNIAVIITLIVNKKPITSSFYNQLLNSNNAVTGYTFGVLLIFNLTYLIPLMVIKKPFTKSIFAMYMILMTVVLVFFILLLFNFFKVKNFETIPFNNLWTIPWAGIGLSFLTIFWYGLRNLWVNPPTLPEKPIIITEENEETYDLDDDEMPSFEVLQLQLKMLKKQLKEVRNIKNKK